MEMEAHNEDQLHKPFSHEFILMAHERWSRKKSGNLGHTGFPTCTSER